MNCKQLCLHPLMSMLLPLLLLVLLLLLPYTAACRVCQGCAAA
jgi:hypothetical protein